MHQQSIPTSVSAPASSWLRRTWIDQTFDVATDVHTLYTLLADLDAWPSFTPGLVAIRRRDKGPVRVGTRFTMVVKPQGAPVPTLLPCQVYVLQPGHIEWGGGVLGSVVRHGFELTPKGPSTTSVRHVEYATGLLAVLALPLEQIIGKFDRSWSRAIEHRFKNGASA